MGCSMGVGCDESGVCYAKAHGQPERCEQTCDHNYIRVTRSTTREVSYRKCSKCGDIAEDK